MAQVLQLQSEKSINKLQHYYESKRACFPRQHVVMSKMVAGVCGGVAEYFNIDPTVVRLIFVILGLLRGSGLLIYIIAAIVMPSAVENFETASDDEVNNLKSANVDSSETKNQKLHSDEEFESYFKKD